MTSDPARTTARPLRLLLLVGVLLVAAVVVLVVAARIADAPSGRTGRDVVEAVRDVDAQAPVVLPVRVPRGYVLTVGDTARGAEAQGPGAVWVFAPAVADSGLSTVQLYVPPPGRSAERPDGVLTRQADGREVWVIAVDPEADRERSRELWGEVEFTTDWPSLEWIDEPLEP